MATTPRIHEICSGIRRHVGGMLRCSGITL